MRQENESSILAMQALGGMSQRDSVSTQADHELDLICGLFPAQVGLLQRLTGKTRIHKFNDPVLHIFQTHDSKGNIIVQTDSNVYVYALDEILARSEEPDYGEKSVALTNFNGYGIGFGAVIVIDTKDYAMETFDGASFNFASVQMLGMEVLLDPIYGEVDPHEVVGDKLFVLFDFDFPPPSISVGVGWNNVIIDFTDNPTLTVHDYV